MRIANFSRRYKMSQLCSHRIWIGWTVQAIVEYLLGKLAMTGSYLVEYFKALISAVWDYQIKIGFSNNNSSRIQTMFTIPSNKEWKQSSLNIRSSRNSIKQVAPLILYPILISNQKTPIVLKNFKFWLSLRTIYNNPPCLPNYAITVAATANQP